MLVKKKILLSIARKEALKLNEEMKIYLDKYSS
jgi:hypothetical protein